ncbi:MAG TPA: CAP domain-containing protein [Alphaproteobacteria bacterium]|jgi:uncharacterized protein YkwD
MAPNGTHGATVLAVGAAILALWAGAARAQEEAVPDRAEVRALQLLNSARAVHRYPPLIPDRRLFCAARAHARDMAATGRLDHEGSDGADLGARLARFGYPHRRAAENIARAGAEPGEVVRLWLASPEHRRNALDPAFRHAGIGRAYDRSAGVFYWTLDLGIEAAMGRPGGARAGKGDAVPGASGPACPEDSGDKPLTAR